MNIDRPDASGTTDPARISTRAELAAGLRSLVEVAGLSYRIIGHRSERLAGRPGRVRLPRATIGDILRSGRLSRDQLLTILQVCGVSHYEVPRWLVAHERTEGHVQEKAAHIRLVDANPRMLGVHPAIPSLSESDLPTYVSRDVDEGIARLLASADPGSIFVLLIGGSCVGKSRTGYELVRTELRDWSLVLPVNTDEIRDLVDSVPVRSVVWLDELQNFLAGASGLTADLMRRLLRGRSVVILATMWSSRYATFSRYAGNEEVDRYAAERELLRMAHVIDIDPILSPTERQRAERISKVDRRIRDALATSDYGMTQVLAAAPQLVRRWEHAPDVYGKAVISAAVDVRRIGVRGLLTSELLRHAASGYLSKIERGLASADWFDRAFRYASETLNGATAAISPLADDVGEIVGYAVADYLIQHGVRRRRTLAIPSSVWQAALVHTKEIEDLERIADNARRRALLCYVVDAYWSVLQLHGADVAARLVTSLEKRGDREGATLLLRARVRGGDRSALRQLANLLIADGDIRQAALLWLSRAESGDFHAARALVDLLVEHHKLDFAMDMLRRRAALKDPYAMAAFATVISENAAEGELARQTGFEQRLDTSEKAGRDALVENVSARAQEQTVDLLRRAADDGEPGAAIRLVDVLARQADVAGLCDEVRAGTPTAAERLAVVLRSQGETVGERNLRRFGMTPVGEIATDLKVPRGTRTDADWGFISKMLWRGVLDA